MLVAGIDVGGTKCLALAVDGEGSVLGEVRVPTPPSDGLVGTLGGLVAELESSLGRSMAGVGVGAPGLVDQHGVLRAAPNVPGTVELAVGPRLASLTERPVQVDNDATCATEAEWRLGAARGATDAVMVTLGTGIGAGLVCGGQLQRGRHGFAGEVGHMVVDPDGPRCPCGRRGCWERYASGSGLRRLAREAAEAGQLAHVVAQAGGDPDGVMGEQVVAAAREGDAEALDVIERFAWWVGLGLVNLTNVLDPEVLVIGGGLARAGDVVLEPVRRAFAELLYAPGHRTHPRIVLATLGERAGALGAALLAGEMLALRASLGQEAPSAPWAPPAAGGEVGK